MPDRLQYPAKLLLFGEYTVLMGGRALAIPMHQAHGSWGLSDQDESGRWTGWIDHLAQGWPTEAIASMNADVAAGYTFISDIPQGYGLGSSGALCAAVYDRYHTSPEDIEKLREDLAFMEGFFHGSSSGMDPLVSHVDQPVLRDGASYTLMKLPDRKTWPAIALLDSGHPRKTSKLVSKFQAMMEQEEFSSRVRTQLLPAVEHCIDHFITAHWQLLFGHLQVISQLQFELFADFIPASVRETWENSLERDDLYLKLCGAGGGGFFLAFADQVETLTSLGAAQVLKMSD